MDVWIRTPQSQSPRGEPRVPQAAAFWKRALALIVDLVILGTGDDALSRLMEHLAGISALYWLVMVVSWGLPLMYFAWPYSHGGQTPGKKLLDIRVVPLDGSNLNWRHGILRTLGYSVSDLSLGLGYLWSILDRDKQAWHDKLAGTWVIQGTQPVLAIVSSEDASSRQRRWWLGVGAATVLLTGCLAVVVFLAWPVISQAAERSVDPASDRLSEALARRWDPDDLIIAAESSFQALSGDSGQNESWFIVEISYAGRCNSSSSDPCAALADELAGIVLDNYERIDELTGVEVIISRVSSVVGITLTQTDVDKRLTIDEWRRELSGAETQPG